ncbi:uncharacterized protein LOC128159017 [Crassostrea angulata]|uniref:uncharacterized protein LOC128159017 n=1 Tax=Magallana angulata TaxID=2784310 RepID=UPI0022B1FB60|nr:uncharacterized protein LOC128159017 [Crassostrea angulata]
MNRSAAGRHNSEGEQRLLYQREVPIEQLIPGSSLIYPQCIKHSLKYCELHCEQCDTQICSECCTSAEHDTHKRVNILDWLQNKKEIIKNDMQELEDSIILKHQTIIAKIPYQRDVISQNAVQIATALHTQEEHLHREIVNVSLHLKAVLYEMDSKHLAFLQNQEEKHRQCISEIQQLISDLNDLLLSDDICRFTKYKSKNANFRNPIQPTVSFPNFLPTKFKRKHIYQQLGCLSKLSIKKEEEYVLNFPDAESSLDGISVSEEPKVVTYIHTNYGDANKLRSVTALTDTEIWTCGEDKTMKLYNLQGELIKSIQTKSKKTPSDIEVTRSGDIVYADYNDLSINIVRNSQISEVIKLEGWRPRNVCSALYDDFLVFMDSDTDRQSKIVRYCGNIPKQSISLNDEGQPLYSYGPSFKYMSENRNLDICVADWGASAVVVVNHAGKHRFTYMGPPSSSSSTKAFDPYGITTDSQSRILIADCFNHRIHILHQDGQFLCFICSCGLERPVDLCVDSKDNLFVAERFTGNVKKIRYKR